MLRLCCAELIWSAATRMSAARSAAVVMLGCASLWLAKARAYCSLLAAVSTLASRRASSALVGFSARERSLSAAWYSFS